MGNSFQFIDIIFFAMIAIFLILRLRGVLGKRDGNEGSGLLDLFKQDNSAVKHEQENKDNNILKMPNNHATDINTADTSGDKKEENIKTLDPLNNTDNPISSGITQVQKFDQKFDSEDFLVGARVAFEMILKAYASADLNELKLLVSNEVYANFANAIQDREHLNHVMEDTLVGIMKSEMVEVYMESKVAHITIKFTSEQVNAVRDEDGNVVQGDANVVLTLNDFWTFARDTNGLDPNWLLVATRSLE